MHVHNAVVTCSVQQWACWQCCVELSALLQASISVQYRYWVACGLTSHDIETGSPGGFSLSVKNIQLEQHNDNTNQCFISTG